MAFKLSEATVDTLLDKLSTDDDFRELFQQDPLKALEAAGHVPTATTSISEEELRGMKSQTLASKDEIKASRDIIRKQLLVEQACQMPIHVNVTKP